MLADYDKILTILKSCKTDNIHYAQTQLKQLASKDIQVLTCIQLSLKDHRLQYDIKIIAVTAISAIFVQNISEFSQEFCFGFLTGILADREIQFQVKNYLNRAVMYSLEQCDQQYLDKWKQFTTQLLTKQTPPQQQTQNGNNSPIQNNIIYSPIQVGIFLLTAFTCSQIQDNLVLELPQTDIMENVMAQILEKINQKSNKNSKKREKLLLYMAQAWKIVTEYMIYNISGKAKEKFFMRMAQNQDFKQILQYSYKTLSTGGGKHFLYLDSQNLQIEPILQIKNSLSEIHYLILSVIFQFDRRKARQTLLYQFTGLHMEFIINSLCFIGFHPQIREQFDIEQNLITMVKLLKILIQDSPQILSNSWRQLLHFLVFPLLKIQSQQLIDFEQNTNGYIELSEDICEKQRLGTLKTQCAKLMQIISDQSQNIIPKSSDPSSYIHCSSSSSSSSSSLSSSQPALHRNQAIITKYILNFAIASIKHHLQMQFFNTKCNNFQNYSLSFNCPDNVNIMDVETAFLVLSIFSFALEYYKKEVQEIRVILCNQRVRIMPPVQRARIFTFLAYNYDQLFSTNPSSIQTLNHWVSIAFLQQKHPTVSYCAMDFITNSLHKLYNQKTIISIIQKIPQTKCINFWPLVKKMIHLFATKMTQQILMQFVKAVYRRIQIQIQNQISNNLKVTYVISTLLHSIRVISQKGQFISTLPNLKSKLWQITNLYHVAIANNFQDQMIKIINCFLYFATKQQVQHRNMTQFLPQFINEFVNVQFQPTYYYIAFNHFIEKGNFNQCVMPIFSVLRSSLEYFFNQEIKDQAQAHRKRIPIAHTLLLLENIVAWHGAQLPQQYLLYLHQKLKCLYPKRVPTTKPSSSSLLSSSNPTSTPTTTKHKLRIYDRSLLSRALLIQLLCSMYTPQKLYISTLTSFIKYHDLKIFYGYDATVLVSCIKLQIFKETNIENLIQLLMIVVRVVYGWREMEVQVKKEKVREIQKQVHDGQYEEEYKIDQEQNQERNVKKSAMILRIKKTSDYQLILAYINTPFKSQQSHPIGYSRPSKPLEQIRRQLSQLLLQLRGSNQALFQSIMTGLSQDMRYKLQTVIQTKMQQILQGQISIYNNKNNKNSNNSNNIAVKDRKIFKVKKVKMGYIDQGKIYNDGVQLQEDSNKRQIVRLGEEDKQGQEGDSQMLKSHKAEKKKKEKKDKFMGNFNA